MDARKVTVVVRDARRLLVLADAWCWYNESDQSYHYQYVSDEILANDFVGELTRSEVSRY